MKTKSFILFIIISLTSCSENLPTFKQKVLFEVHYVNYAWGYVNNGYLIDSLGYARSFNLKENKINWHSPDSTGYISLSDMNDNLSHCDSVIFHLNPDSLALYVGKIYKASKGQISKPQMVMADAGSIRYSAFIYNEKLHKYKEVLIKEWGDWMITNDSQEAQDIYDWLIRINKK